MSPITRPDYPRWIRGLLVALLIESLILVTVLSIMGCVRLLGML